MKHANFKNKAEEAKIRTSGSLTRVQSRDGKGLPCQIAILGHLQATKIIACKDISPLRMIRACISHRLSNFRGALPVATQY